MEWLDWGGTETSYFCELGEVGQGEGTAPYPVMTNKK